MSSILQSIRRLEYRFDAGAERFVCRHPAAGFLAVFVGGSLLILAAVCLCAGLIAIPIAWLCG